MANQFFHNRSGFPIFRTLSPVTAFVNEQLNRSPHYRASGSADDDAVFHPRLDLREDNDNYYVDVDLPGVEKSSIQIGIEDGVLTITAPLTAASGQKDPDSNDDNEKPNDNRGLRYLRRERARGRYEKQLYLGDSIDETSTTASYKCGVLSLTLPKPDHSAPKGHTVPVH